MTNATTPTTTPSPFIRPFALSFPAELPITERREEIVAAIKAHQVVIISGETGSGKTTQLPKMCLEAGLGQKGSIGCTQPRRIAALSISRRIAEELSCTWGEEVGCKIRFSDHTKKNTVIKVMTDGVLLAEARHDPLLSSYEAIIIDEAHERSLNIDFLLGYLRHLVTRRTDLKIIITSATIDTLLFSEAFNNAPIIEVSGRLFPVEIRYSGTNLADDDQEELSYVEHAVHTVRNLLAESIDGDILVFMPSERDIRETCELLTDKTFEALPLMGSLSASEQERVFRSSGRRKVIVATNIAETSLTIPNIRYVVDTGLARISRYSPRSRTKRLPIEKVAKSSANQRAGRAGRVREGVCIRLYNEEEFTTRPDFTDPEILRSNLADVILRMKAFHLGEIETFPFLNSPDPRAVRSGYSLLHELGALDSENRLTRIGRDLSRLPVDPTIGRMLLQARHENALSDVIVIAAGLSIQDPRERPVEKRQQAEEKHRAFSHPDSDFLTLLNLWNSFQKERESGKSQNNLRRFCKEHFLSYMRMREWADVHGELASVLSHNRGAKTTDCSTIKLFDGPYRAIHRSVLSGHVSQVAYRSDVNIYRSTAGRQLTVSPGSALLERRQRGSEGDSKHRKPGKDPSKERWIVAAEIVETTKTFARTAARIAPGWIEEIGSHLIRRRVEDPLWSDDKRCVMANEQTSLQGLVLAVRRVPYSRSAPVEAREIFIRSVLVSQDSTAPHSFIQSNRKLCDKIASRLAHVGKLNRHALEENLVEFYVKRLPEIASLMELERFVKEHKQTELLEATPNDLWEGISNVVDEQLFPDRIDIAGTAVDVHYRYSPGGERDGVTLSLPLELAKRLPPRALDGVIPGLREQQVLYLIRALPKQYRLQLDNFTETARCIAADEALQRLPLLEGIAHVLQSRFSVSIPISALSLDELPDHLRPRFEVATNDGVVASARDLSLLSDKLPVAEKQTSTPAWASLRANWERHPLTSWDFDELPEKIEVATVSGVPVYLYPALVQEGESVALRLLDDRATAISQSQVGAEALAVRVLSREVQDLTKQSKALDSLKPLITLFTTPDQLKSSAVTCALSHIFHGDPCYPLRRVDFDTLITTAKKRIPGLMDSIVRWTKGALELRREVLSTPKHYSGLRRDLDLLLPADFLIATPFEQITHLPRYLKAMRLRAERADNDPVRHKERSLELARYESILQNKPQQTPPDFRWMVEEFKVSLFAQELGTAYPISAKRLDKVLALKA
jgi:ATP-dependent helicase HrpA